MFNVIDSRKCLPFFFSRIRCKKRLLLKIFLEHIFFAFAFMINYEFEQKNCQKYCHRLLSCFGNSPFRETRNSGAFLRISLGQHKTKANYSFLKVLHSSIIHSNKHTILQHSQLILIVLAQPSSLYFWVQIREIEQNCWNKLERKQPDYLYATFFIINHTNYTKSGLLCIPRTAKFSKEFA